MLREIIKRAAKDTTSGKITDFLVLIAGTFTSILFLRFALGWDKAVEEIPYAIAGIISVFGGLIFLFFINLICAPFRIEREAHNQTKQDLEVLKALNPIKNRRKLNQEQKASLADAIRDVGVSPESLNVVYFATSEDCADFASDLGEAIKNSGIECTVHNGVMYEHDAKDRGVKIYYSKSKTLALLAGAIQKQLKEFGYAPEKLIYTKSDGKIFLYVARRSDSD